MNKIQNADGKVDILDEIAALDNNKLVDHEYEDPVHSNSEAATNDKAGRITKTHLLEMAEMTKVPADISPGPGPRSDDLNKSSAHSPEEMLNIIKKAHKLNDLGNL